MGQIYGLEEAQRQSTSRSVGDMTRYGIPQGSAAPATDTGGAVDVLCGTPGSEGAHASTIRRMIAAAPPFRPQATTDELVAEFLNSENRMAAFLALYARGDDVLPVVREVLRHPN